MVEHDRRTAALITRNAATLGFSRARVVATSVASFLASPPAAPYDVVFSDPPYPMSDADVDADLAALTNHGWLVPGALVVVERAAKRTVVTWPPGIEEDRTRRYGETALWYGHATPAPRSRDGTRAPAQPHGRTPVRRAVCPGSFDPVTNGHLDIVGRAARLFDEVVVAVGVNMSKNRLFTPDERIAMLRDATSGLANVRVSGFDGLIVDFCREIEAVAIVKGLRGAGDYEYELPMAQMNSHLTAVETVFLPGAVGNAFVSSSLIKEVAALGGDVRGLVPEPVREQLVARLAERRA
jgi:pantetheine-phosphate adenylyltransferase